MEPQVDEVEGNLGQGFMSADDWEEVDIWLGDKHKMTYVGAKLDPEFKHKLVRLLKEYRDCFA